MPPQQNKRKESAVANKDGESVSLQYAEEYEGLIPHPKLMEQWDKLIPGSAEKIFNRFEKQSDHRMDIEKRVVKANNFKQYIGPIFAFIISILAIGGGIYIALHGSVGLGGILSFAGLGTVVAPFLVNTFKVPKNTNIKK
jgi:uncharacterized membrane protein